VRGNALFFFSGEVGGLVRFIALRLHVGQLTLPPLRPLRGPRLFLRKPGGFRFLLQLHLDEIATKITPGAHAILLLDQAGWHGAKALKVPNNISLLQLPPRAPELNGQENISQFMRQNWLSNRIFKSFDDIVDHCCYAWNTLIDQPWKIMSIARRDWAAAGHSI
jgi:hypothetical protein